MLANKNIKQCICNQDSAIFHCDKGCVPDQVFYCATFCATKHDHAPLTIVAKIVTKNEKWTKLMEKIEDLNHNCTKMFD